jgi:DNA replication and repair protein RecF
VSGHGGYGANYIMRMLSRLILDHFRNYDHQELRFAPGANLLIGSNGQGKTNILEAVYYLSLLRSFRTGQLEHLTQYGRQDFCLYGEVTDGTAQGLTRLGVRQGRQREFVVNGAKAARASEFITRLVCAAFIPEDLDIIKGAPGLRRRFLNIALCQLQPEYMRALQDSNNALKCRNEMLKIAQKYQRETVTAYDSILVQLATKIEFARRQLASQLNSCLESLSAEFFPDGRIMSVKFLTGCGMLMDEIKDDEAAFAAQYAKTLQNSYERDCRDRATRFGVHRSDLACLLDGRLLSNYGSEGECRTSALALRLAVTEILRQALGANSVTLLVDDVLGELDATRRDAFLQHIWAAGQVIFAGTHVPPGIPADAAVFSVARGQVVSKG